MPDPSLPSAYIPCFNNEATLPLAVASIRAQQPPVAELFVIDDASTDRSVEIAENLGVRVFRNPVNLGRGAVRARAMSEARHDLVLSCDAGKVLEPGFLATALPWLEHPNVAAVFGRTVAGTPGSVANRWRSRHLFKADIELPISRKASLVTAGTVIRKSLADRVGGFDASLRHSEDADLGERLLRAGCDVVYDPALRVSCTTDNTVLEVLERYWRWYAGKNESITPTGYLKQIVYSIKVMALQDLHAGDPLAVPISLLSPHYQFWRTLLRRIASQNQTVRRE